MREPKFDVGDVVRVRVRKDLGAPAISPELIGKTGRVVRIMHISVGFGYGIEFEEHGYSPVIEEWLEGVPLEEVRRYYADKPRRGFIVDGLTVDELESGQEEAYESFQHAADEARREETRQAAEDDRQERRVLTELVVSFILWLVCGVVSLICWNVCGFEGAAEAHVVLLGLWCTVVGMIAVCKPMVSLIAVCKEQIKERKKRSPRNME